MKDIKVIKNDEKNEFVSYNLTKKLAEVFNTKEEFRDVEQTPSDLFSKDLPTVKKLVKKKINELDSEIKKNKLSLNMSVKSENTFKIERAKRELKRNNNEYNYLISWLKSN